MDRRSLKRAQSSPTSEHETYKYARPVCAEAQMAICQEQLARRLVEAVGLEAHPTTANQQKGQWIPLSGLRPPTKRSVCSTSTVSTARLRSPARPQFTSVQARQAFRHFAILRCRRADTSAKRNETQKALDLHKQASSM